MRIKYRWYICQLELGSGGAADDAAEPITASDVYNAVRGSVQECFGDVGFAQVQATLAVKHYSAATGLCLVRGPAESDKEVHAAIVLTRALRKRQAAIRVLQTCCTARTLKPAAAAWAASLTARAARGGTGAGAGAAAAGGAARGPSKGEDFLAAVDKEVADAEADA